MIAQNVGGTRTPGQKVVRMVWVIARTVASFALTLGLLAMVPQLFLGFAALIGMGWFIKHGPSAIASTVKGVGFFCGAIVASIWKGL